MLFGTALEEYRLSLRQQEKSERTIKGYLQDLKFFENWLQQVWNGPVYLDDVTFTDVEKFLTFLKEKKSYKPASRRRIASALKSFFRYAWKRELCRTDIASDIEDIKYVPTEREFLSEEEALQLIEEIDHELVKVFTVTLLYTGMRISEALALTIDDVDMDTDWIHIRNGKGGKARSIPINRKLKDKLEDYVQWRTPSKQFFATKKTGTLSSGTVQAVIRETRERLGCKKKITPHVFRHSFASELVKKDANIVSISKLLGHSNLKTTSVYTHVSQNQLIDAIARL